MNWAKMRELEYEKQQKNYQKLMLLMRDLSFKLKEAETPKQQIEETSYQDKIKKYYQKFKKKKISDWYESTSQRWSKSALIFEVCIFVN